MTRAQAASININPDQPTLDDMVAELTEATKHRESIGAYKRNNDGSQTWVSVDRWITFPSLIEQLHHATFQAAQNDEGARPGYMSKPTARLEAIGTIARIDGEANAWLDRLGHRRRGDTARRVRALASLLPSVDQDVYRAVVRDVRHWHTLARIFSGWEEPPWKPNNTCPPCGVRGEVRVRLDIRSAVCGNCKEIWTPATIGVLADHIRAEDEAAGQKRTASAVWVGRPCHCRACDPDYRFWRMCPICGHVEGACAKPADHRFPCTGPTV